MFIPVPKEFDDSDAEGNPDIGLLTGIRRSAIHDLNYDTTVELSQMAHDNILPGSHLTDQGYEQSEYKRPGITFPNGVSEARAKRSAQRYDLDRRYDNVMSGLHSGFLRGVSKFVGGAIAFTMDPLNLFAGSLAIRGVAPIVEPLANLAAEYGLAGKLGFKFASSALVAAGATAPQGVVNYTAGKVYGEDPSVLNVLAGLAMNAGLGGFLGTAFSKPMYGAIRRVIPKSEHFNALRTAVAQLEGGSKVNTDEILQNGMYQQENIDKLTKAQFSPEEIEQNNVLHRTQAIDDLRAKRADLGKVEGFDDVKEEVDKHLDLLEKGEPSDDIDFELPKTPDSLKPEPISPKDIENGDYDENKILRVHEPGKQKALDAWNAMVDNMAKIAMADAAKDPVDTQQIKAAEARTKSAENANAHDPQDSLQADREAEEAKQETQTGEFGDNEIELKEPDIASLRDDVEALADKLPKAIREHVENIDEIEDSHNSIAKAMEKLSNCMRGIE